MNRSEKTPAETTKRALADALKEKMVQKPLSKITVRELTEACGMNRQTFYYHFEDIYDLLRWMYREEAVSLLQQHEGVLMWQDGLLQLFRYIQENRAMCLCALKSLGRDHLKRFFLSDIHAIIHRTIDVLTDDLMLEESEKELLTQYYVIALSGLIESWLLGDLVQTPEQLIAFADRMLQDQIRGAYLRCGRPMRNLQDF